MGDHVGIPGVVLNFLQFFLLKTLFLFHKFKKYVSKRHSNDDRGKRRTTNGRGVVTGTGTVRIRKDRTVVTATATVTATEEPEQEHLRRQL